MSRKFFRIILTGIVLFNFFQGYAQDYAETALLFSRTRPAGSARILGMGGAQTALGGDYSSGLSNPAGLGMFNRSEFTISPAFSSNTTSSSYLGNNSSDNRSVINIPGLSYSFHMPKDNGSFLGGTFSISLQRTNDYNQAITYGAPNKNSSIVDYFIDQAYGYPTSAFKSGGQLYNDPTGLAYHNYLIGPKSILNPPGSPTEYFTDAGYPNLQQEQTIVKGASNQWNFSYGANFNDKFFVGGGIGIASIRYKSQKTFSETFNPDTLQYLQLNENLDIRGTGFNATIGVIARPVDFFQIGASLTTPTFYSLVQTYDATLSTRWNNFDYNGDGSNTDGTPFLNNESAGTDLVTSSYGLTTPMKFSAGIAFIGKMGLLTADIDMMNPAKARYTSVTSGISYSQENNDIRSLYQGVVNYRMGGELRLNMFRLRAGYGYQPNTYKSALNADNHITTITGGAGVRTKDFYIDFALIQSNGKQNYQPYTFFDGSGPVVNMKNSRTTGMVTVGFNF